MAVTVGDSVPEIVNLDQKFSLFTEHWSPKIVARMNDYHLKVVKFQGEFVWHAHPETDEVFLVVDGEMVVHFRDHDVRLGSGELLVVPKGVEHKTSAANECRVLIVEPSGTVNTGDAGGEMTAPVDVWI